MPDHDRRRELRGTCSLNIEVFLSQGRGGPAASPLFPGILTSISRSGAGIALTEVMAGRTHLAYGPMESATLQLNLVFPAQNGDTALTTPVRPVWLNKETGGDLPPFRLGVEFLETIPPAILQRLNRLVR